MADAQEVQEIKDTKDKLKISKAARKINLTNTFGKAATLVGIGGMGYTLFELGRVIVFATDTATQATFNPADHVLPGLIAFGVSMTAGLTGMYLGRQKHKLSNEFNYQVKKEFANMGFELVEDDNEQDNAAEYSNDGGRTNYRWARRRSYDDYDHYYRQPTVYRPRHDRFWEGFWLASWMNSGSGSSSSSGSSYSGGSNNNNNNGQGAAIALAAIVLAAAVAASAYVSYKSFQLNFVKKSPALLTGPEPEVFVEDEQAVDVPAISGPSNGPSATQP